MKCAICGMTIIEEDNTTTHMGEVVHYDCINSYLDPIENMEYGFEQGAFGAR